VALVLYILDEPSIGCNQRDNASQPKLNTSGTSADIGIRRGGGAARPNSKVSVEHDEETMSFEADNNTPDVGTMRARRWASLWAGAS